MKKLNLTRNTTINILSLVMYTQFETPKVEIGLVNKSFQELNKIRYSIYGDIKMGLNPAIIYDTFISKKGITKRRKGL